MTTAAKAQAALDRRRRSEETLAALWIRVHGSIPRHWRDVVETIDQWFADRAAHGPATTTRRICVKAPPGWSKSTLATLVAARAMTRGVDCLYLSYSGSLAKSKSAKVQKLVKEYLGAKIDAKVSSPVHWQIAAGGSMHASGLTGSATGFRGGVVIVDDHTAGRASAESQALREQTNDAVTSVARTRADPGSLVLMVSTAWHPDDASARAIAAGYEVVHVPAIGADGESTWPERFSTASMLEMQDELGDRDWASLYCGSPQQNASLLFRGVQLMQPKDLPTAGLTITAGLDLAYSSRSSADSSVAVILAQIPNGPAVVIDVLREQRTIEDLIPRLVAFSEKHGKPAFRWRTGGQEGAVATMLRAAGLRVQTEAARIDKISNAQRAASAWNRGRIAVLAGQKWTDKFVAVVTAFGPGAKHDDDVDALCNAYDGVPSEAVDHGWQYAPARKAWSINDVMPQLGTPEFSASTGWAQSQARRNRIGGM